MFEGFPNLHPLVVHFPIVLLLLAAFLQGLLVFWRWQQISWATLLLMGAAFIGAWAVSTGFHAMPEGLEPRAAAIFEEHEQYARYTLWLAGITLLLKGLGSFYFNYRRAYEGLVFGTALAAAMAVSVAGHHGAQLVYLEGVGPQGHLVQTTEQHSAD